MIWIRKVFYKQQTNTERQQLPPEECFPCGLRTLKLNSTELKWRVDVKHSEKSLEPIERKKRVEIVGNWMCLKNPSPFQTKRTKASWKMRVLKRAQCRLDLAECRRSMRLRKLNPFQLRHPFSCFHSQTGFMIFDLKYFTLYSFHTAHMSFSFPSTKF